MLLREPIKSWLGSVSLSFLGFQHQSFPKFVIYSIDSSNHFKHTVTGIIIRPLKNFLILSFIGISPHCINYVKALSEFFGKVISTTHKLFYSEEQTCMFFFYFKHPWINLFLLFRRFHP